MERFHVITGLPRSGSTLLANVLSQHPDVYVSGTSPLSSCVASVVNTLDSEAEVIAQLASSAETVEAYSSALRGFVQGWFSGHPEKVCIDKGRGWIIHALRMVNLFPDSKLVVIIRDPREVIASIERQHRQSGLFSSPIAPTIYDATEALMLKDGMVGGPIRFVEDIVRRNLPNVELVRYETLMIDPITVLGRLGDVLDLTDFKFDTKKVKNVAPDLDALYRGKYPHEGSGEIISPEGTWRDSIDPDLGAKIASVYPFYMQSFGYV